MDQLQNAEGDQNHDVSLPFQSIIDQNAEEIMNDNELIVFQENEQEEQKLQEINVTCCLKQQIMQLPKEIDIELAKTPNFEEKKNQVDLQATFLKRSPHKLQGKIQCICTLEKRVLKYYSSKNKNVPQGILDFDTQEYKFEYSRDKKQRIKSICLKPSESPKIFDFKVVNRNDEQNEEWVRLIQNYILYSIGRKRHLQALSISYRFWRHNRIGEDEVLKTVQTGDLMIFRSKGVLPSMQRSLTGSDYDHIVMFLRYDQKQLMLFETSNQYGVIEFSFLKFIQARSYSHYEKIIFKRLQNVQNSDRMCLLQHAVLQLGKGYSLSPMKLLRKSKRKNFFCSELIAYVYQLIGLLPLKEKACMYLPGHFTNEKDVKLLKGASLSEDFLIDFYNY